MSEEIIIAGAICKSLGITELICHRTFKEPVTINNGDKIGCTRDHNIYVVGDVPLLLAMDTIFTKEYEDSKPLKLAKGDKIILVRTEHGLDFISTRATGKPTVTMVSRPRGL